MNKKFLSLIILSTCILCSVQNAMAAKPVTIKVGGDVLSTDVKAEIVNNRTLVPLRAIFEAMDIDVDYIADTKTVVAEKNDTKLELTIGSDIIKLNNEEKKIDVPATIKNNRTLVPLRVCAESFDLDVEWNDKTKTVKVKKGVWLVSQVTRNGKMYTKYTYDERGNKIRMEGPSINNEYNPSGWYEYTYDENDNLTHYKTMDSRSTSYEYDEQGMMISSLFIDADPSLGGRSKKSKYVYDENCNLISVENPSNGNVYTSYTYDSNGNLLTKTDSYITYTYDQNRNLISEEYPGGSWIKYSYNKHNKLTSKLTASGTSTTYTYDENNNLIREEVSHGDWTNYTYDENNNLIKKENNNGIVTEYTYDENNNLKTETVSSSSNPTSVTEYEYIYIIR